MPLSQLPALLSAYFADLCAAIDRRSAPRLLLLLVGALFAKGRRTVTSWFRAAGITTEFRTAYRRTQWDLTRADGQFLEHFFETIGRLDIFTAIIPGTMDTALDVFLKLGMAAELEFPALHVVHALLVAKGDVAICGLGSSLSEEGGGDGECYSRIRAEYHLRPLWDAKQPYKILLLASPPPGALGGREGNAVAGDFIDSYHPGLCVVGGPGKCHGTQRIANTLVINPGLLAEGSAAWLDWDQAVDEQVEFLNLCALKSLRLTPA